MNKTDEKYQAYVQILKEELVPAMGCTEPIALAYAAAKAREVLGCLPDKVVIEASGSIIKNVKSVIVPNTNHLKGIPGSCHSRYHCRKTGERAGGYCGSNGRTDQRDGFIPQKTEISVEHVNNGITFEIIVTVSKGDSYAKVRIANYHTNIVLIEKDMRNFLRSGGRRK